MRILSVAYPFAPVTADPAGGAEQVLAALDRALVAAGHESEVIAAEGSTPAGALRPVPAVAGAIDDEARTHVHAAVRAAIAGAVDERRPDLIHFHGIDFPAYLPEGGPPRLATLHLPLDWYDTLAVDAALVPVSDSQAARAAGTRLLPPVENGVDLDAYRPRDAKGDYALILGRVAPEKGFHDALAAARAAEVPLIAAGEVYPYPAHRTYFAAAVAPRLDARRRFIGPVAGAEKRRLLAGARCLLVPSTAPETSSLAAMEALASGTPVIAYRSGALPDIVEHGVTGLLVDGPGEMAAAIGRIEAIDRAACRRAAEARFGIERMIAGWFALYERLAA